MKSTSNASLPPTVLLLEDDPDFAIVAADTMRESGLTVLTALHPWDAFRHLDSGLPIDLFLSDIRMPVGMPHGFAMGRMARYRRPELKLLYLTAYPEMADANGTPLAKVLFKPIRPEALIAEVREALAAGSGDAAR